MTYMHTDNLYLCISTINGKSRTTNVIKRVNKIIV